MKEKEKWLQHIITAAAFAVFIVLGLACMTVGPNGPELATSSNSVSDKNAEAAFNRGVAAYNAGNYDQAIAEFTEAIWRIPNPDSVNAANIYGNRGMAYMNKGDLDRAAEDFEAVLKITPDNADARQLLEMVRFEQQNKGISTQ